MRYTKLALLSAIVFVFVLGAAALRNSIAEVEEPTLELTAFDLDLSGDPVADLLISARRNAPVGDGFDRPDRVGLGTGPGGVPWADLGNWRIRDGVARLTPMPGSAEPYLAITEGPAGERLVRVEMATMGGGAGLLFGYRNASDYWALIATPAFASWQVLRVFDGETGMVTTLQLAPTDDGTEVAVHITDDRLDFLVDGRSHARLATQLHPDATLAGLVALRATDAAWDDFAIATAPR